MSDVAEHEFKIIYTGIKMQARSAAQKIDDKAKLKPVFINLKLNVFLINEFSFANNKPKNTIRRKYNT